MYIPNIRDHTVVLEYKIPVKLSDDWKIANGLCIIYTHPAGMHILVQFEHFYKGFFFFSPRNIRLCVWQKIYDMWTAKIINALWIGRNCALFFSLRWDFLTLQLLHRYKRDSKVIVRIFGSLLKVRVYTINKLKSQSIIRYIVWYDYNIYAINGFFNNLDWRKDFS